MFYDYIRTKDISDYGADKKLRFDAVLKIFQEAAVAHSASVGYSADTYMGRGNIWILNRLMAHAEKFPDFAQELSVRTWSRGLDRFKGFRNYEIRADGEICIKGSSIWLYIDIERKRPVRVTPQMYEDYQSENVCNMCSMIDGWDRKDAEKYDRSVRVQLRPADFDINGHMNNIRYGELLSLASSDMDFTGKTVGLFYNHEIKPETEFVDVRIADEDKSRIVSIFDGDTLACLCEII
ncbi:acyl-[acyl-carrier-protein] thioesterase [Seleniivibrio woodruffii]|uniref:Medium-chain acyl-[acyl-carrier-protein] hydrolase n=1 Tax=Seleniivibrio woodruffii TaxID=1078050 RepID=A0A4R1KD37_9BACT|nr:acyl-ACP thioesterase domain-containing protein [Seleniivibrio woodruffii]TCK62485.1 medium-chain acyl-[acyl-carrier-protein] hydrolase [Seleniivibrio woodruffii]TVZ37088.1 medium-chain acyl-[acyl-carrier-protein] hydrolase [Seleniivibrio woodruffii]